MAEWLREFYSGVESRQQHWFKAFYCGAYFALTFILLSYTSYAWSASNAWDFGYTPLFSYDGIDNLQGTKGWTLTKIGWVYLAPPIWGLVTSILSLVLFQFIDGKKTHLRTILFWFSLNGFLLYFSYIVSGILSGQDYGSKFFTGFVGFYSWLEWGKGKIYAILVLQLLLSLIYPLLFSKPILRLNYSRYLAARPNGKSILFLNVIILPFLIGSVLLQLGTFPLDFGMQTVRIFSYLPIFLIVFLGFGLHKAKHISIVKGGLRPTPIVGLVLLTVAILASRFMLELRVEPFW